MANDHRVRFDQSGALPEGDPQEGVARPFPTSTHKATVSRPLDPRSASTGQRLRAAIAWNTAGNVTYAVTQWLIVAILSRVGSAELVGRFALALAISAPIVALTNLGLRDALSSATNLDVPFRTFLRLRLLTTAAAAAVLLLVLGTLSSPDPLLLAVGVSKLIEAISDVCYAQFQRTERLERSGISLVLRGGGGALLFTSVLLGTADVVLATSLMAALWLLVLVGHDLPRTREERQPPSLGPSLRLLCYRHLPLGITALALASSESVPRYALEIYANTESVGLFAAAWYLQVPGGLLVMSLGQTLVVRFARAYVTGDKREFSRILRRALLLVGIAFAISLAIVVLCSDALLNAAYGPGFLSASACLVLLTCASGFRWAAGLLNYALVGISDFRASAAILATSSLLICGLAFLTVPRAGIIGAAVAVLGGSVIRLIATGARVAQKRRSIEARSRMA